MDDQDNITSLVKVRNPSQNCTCSKSSLEIYVHENMIFPWYLATAFSLSVGVGDAPKQGVTNTDNDTFQKFLEHINLVYSIKQAYALLSRRTRY